MTRPLRQIAVAALAALSGFGGLAVAQAETISNTAVLRYRAGGAEHEVRSNTVSLETTPVDTPSSAQFLRPVPNGSVVLPVDGGQCRLATGLLRPALNTASAPASAAGAAASHTEGEPLTFAPGAAFHAGENLYFSVEDGDRNRDGAVRDSVEVTVRASTGDRETMVLLETAENSGVFAGFLPTRDTPPIAAGDCVLSVDAGVRVSLEYGDDQHRQDTAQATALIDPFGVTFDSETGEVVDGVRVTMVDATTGQPAAVFGDDGVSAYPSSVISGQTVRDAGGVVYPGVKGHYRFPLMATGRYRLVVEPTEGWRAPSQSEPVALRRFNAPDGGGLEIAPASFGLAFSLVGPAPLRVDLPLDPVRKGLLLEKTASVAEASAGDFVQYRLTLQNPNTRGALKGASIRDTLPAGLRVRPASVTVAGRKTEARLDGRTLDIPLGALAPAARVEVAYVVQVDPSAREGVLINRAVATTEIGVTSNEARAALRITPALMSGVLTLTGRVVEGACTSAGEGVEGVRVMLEDGRYVVTDRDGLYHLEGVRPGVHVVQLDLARLPAGLEPLACDDGNRAAGRSFSRFVDAGGGALWRNDFRLRRTAAKVARAVGPARVVSAASAAGAETDFLAGATPGVDWVFPELDHNPRAPAVRVAVKHRPDQTVRLSINGRPVEPLAFDGVQVGADRQVAVSVWRGVPLADGANRLTASVSAGPSGPAVELERVVHYANTPARATLAPARSRLAADGVNRPVIAVRVTDPAGRPVRAGTTGMFHVLPPYRAALELDAEQERQLAGLETGVTTWRVEGDDGVALIELAPTTQTGSVILNFDFPGQREVRTQTLRAWLEAGQQDWVVVGFAAGTAGYATLRDHGVRIPDSGSDAAAADGQVSLYAKGRIGGDWLLTMAYDSEKPSVRDGRRALLSTIDPGRYYTIYGDGAEQAFDAASSKKLYLRLDRKQVYALFGDYETGLTDTELSRYSRSLTGLKAERRGEVVNGTAFAAMTDLRFAREELQGSGLAGLYRLSRRDIVLNSDKVRIETRHRFRSELVLETRHLTRHIDYDIDYDTGGLSFREPVLSRDRDLNPVFIVVEYETAGSAGETLNAGGRVTATLRDGRVVLGASAIHDDAEQVRTDLAGLDATIRLTPATELRLELAATRRESDANPAASARTGLAYLAELEHRGPRLDALAYVREQQDDFGLGQQNLSEAGSRKIGADVRYDLSERLSVLGTAYREDYAATDSSRNMVEGSLEHRTDSTTLRVGGRHVEDRVPTGTLSSDQLVLGASRRFLNKRLELTGEKSFSLGDEGESVDFPGRTRVGLAYALRESVRLLASHEIAEGEAFDAANTQFGVDASPWNGAQVDASLNQGVIGENGTRTFALFGMRQSFVFDERWSADVSLDSGRTLAGRIDPALAPSPGYTRASGGSRPGLGLVEDFWAVSTGATYRSELWSWTGRAELRAGDEGDRAAVSTGFLRQTEAGVAFAAGAHASRIEDKTGGSATSATANLTWAYRPLESSWSLLDKLELRIDERTAGLDDALNAPTRLGPGVDGKLRRVINNLALNYDTSAGDADRRRRDLQMSLYYGSKWVFDRFDGEDYAGYTDVLGVEVRRDVSDLFDVGFNAAVQHAWQADSVAYSFGPSIGIAPFANAWLSVGYNIAGFEDRDGSASRYTRQGPYATMRFKFDQLTPKDIGRALRRGSR